VDVDGEILAQSALPGQTVTYTLQVENTGNITDTFDLAASGNAWAVTLPVNQTELGSGASIIVAVQVEVPLDALAGDVDVAAISATSQGAPVQADSAYLTTTALPVYAVGVDPASLESSGYPGALVEYSLTLSNHGNITDTYDLSLAGNEWAVALPVTYTELAPGASIDVSVQVLVPAGAAEAEADSVTVTAVSQADPEVSAGADLTTMAIWRKVYLPLIE